MTAASGRRLEHASAPAYGVQGPSVDRRSAPARAERVVFTPFVFEAKIALQQLGLAKFRNAEKRTARAQDAHVMTYSELP